VARLFYMLFVHCELEERESLWWHCTEKVKRAEIQHLLLARERWQIFTYLRT